MEPGLDERTTGVDLAGDLLLVELAVGPQRDQRGRRLLAVLLLERSLHRLQRDFVHPAS